MNSEFQTRLLALRESYGKKLPGKIANIECQWQALIANFNSQEFKDFHRSVHSLCGASGLYGYDELSKICGDLECYLRQRIDAAELTPDDNQYIAQCLAAIKESAKPAP